MGKVLRERCAGKRRGCAWQNTDIASGSRPASAGPLLLAELLS